MPTVIHFLGGTDLFVENKAANVVDYLSSGWAAVDLEDGTKAHVNGANVLYVEEQQEEGGEMIFET